MDEKLKECHKLLETAHRISPWIAGERTAWRVAEGINGMATADAVNMTAQIALELGQDACRQFAEGFSAHYAARAQGRYLAVQQEENSVC